jgi:hypothetical protein
MATRHTPGPWRVGKGGSVVADVKSHPHSDQRDFGYYGGYLIAESIARDADREVIGRAPDFVDVFGHPGFRSFNLAPAHDAEGSHWQYVLLLQIDDHPLRFVGDTPTFVVATAAHAIRESAANARAAVLAELRSQALFGVTS